MAILSVLWGLALLSVVAVSLLATGQLSYRLSRNTLDSAVVQSAAEAAVHRGVLALLDQRPDRRWPVDGVAQVVDLHGTAVRIAIQDELGRIDLNHAEGSLIESLFGAAGLDAQAAARMADKILDWREASGSRRVGGANAQDYRAAGIGHRPRHGPFQSVDELLLVMDMTPELFRRVQPAVTVYSGRPLIDPNVAPREALLALPTMTAERADAALAARRASKPAASAIPLQPNLAGRAFTIRAEVRQAEGARIHEATVRLTGDPARPFWILAWNSR